MAGKTSINARSNAWACGKERWQSEPPQPLILTPRRVPRIPFICDQTRSERTLESLGKCLVDAISVEILEVLNSSQLPHFLTPCLQDDENGWDRMQADKGLAKAFHDSPSLMHTPGKTANSAKHRQDYLIETSSQKEFLINLCSR